MSQIDVRIPISPHESLPGRLTLPAHCRGIVLFAHGSGSSRLSPRNVQVADYLHQGGIGTLLFDLLTPEEAESSENVFDIGFLASRLKIATKWVCARPECEGLSIGYFGASTGGGAALWAAADSGQAIQAIISRGGRPDLAMPRLREVTVPTLLIVGGEDRAVLDLNQQALRLLKHGTLAVVPGATHLFEEPGALEAVCEAALGWFKLHLNREKSRRSTGPIQIPETFANREQGGALLAERLRGLTSENPLVLGIPRGAIPMASRIASELQGDLDVVLVHKIGAPDNPEYAIGSVSEFGTVHRSSAGRELGIDDTEFAALASREISRLRELRRTYSPLRPPLSVTGRTVIIVDDGIATGWTALAAVRAVRGQRPAKVIVATPVASQTAYRILAEEADAVEALRIPSPFYSVGQFYTDFGQISDEEVATTLSASPRRQRGTPRGKAA